MNVLRTMFQTKWRGQSIRRGGDPKAEPKTAADAETTSATTEQCPVVPTNCNDSAPAVVVGAPNTTATASTTATSAHAPKRLMTSRELVDEAMRSINEHDDALPSFFADDADICFPEASMTALGYSAEFSKVFDSFPDFRLELIGDIIEHEEDGSVSCTVQASGTHTGAPFSFGPYPEVAATGIVLQQDREQVRYFFDKDGKVKKMVVTPHGIYSGPPGMYTQIGGLII